MASSKPNEGFTSNENRQLVDVTKEDVMKLNGFTYTVNVVPASGDELERFELKGFGDGIIYHTLIVDPDGRIYVDTSVKGLDRRPSSVIARKIEGDVASMKEHGASFYGGL